MIYPQNIARSFRFSSSSRSHGVFFLFLLLSVMFGAMPQGHAAGDFVVTKVQVDATAKTASKARDKALATGQADALQVLLRRMTLQADWVRLPKPTGRDLVALVRNLDIRNERSGRNRYLAELDVTFKAGAIRNLLVSNGLGYSETRAQPVLVLPVYRRDTLQTLWDDPNPWRDEWVKLLAEGEGRGAVPFLVPDGDLEDIQLVVADDAVVMNPESLSAIAAAYDVETVLVSVATESRGGDQAKISFDFLGSAGLAPGAVIMDSGAGQTWADAVRYITNRLGDEWKKRTLSGVNFRQSADVRVVYQSLQDWIEMQETLSNLPIVRDMQPREISNRTAIVRLTFDGDFELLNLSLRQSGLMLVDRGFGPMVERLSTSGGQAPGSNGL